MQLLIKKTAATSVAVLRGIAVRKLRKEGFEKLTINRQRLFPII